MSPSATSRGDAALASTSDVEAGCDRPASAGEARGNRSGGDAPSALTVSAPAESPEDGGERSPPPRHFAGESFDGDDAGGAPSEDAIASPPARRREDEDDEDFDDGRADAPGSPVARVRTPDLKLRRPKPKESAYRVVIKPRTPSPEPPTPPPSHPETPAASESESEDDAPPSPEPPPPARADARLAGKKLRLTVLGVRNAPIGLGDVFCVVECGSAVLETTVSAPPPDAAPVPSAASSFEIFFDAPGASGDVTVAATGERGTPRAPRLDGGSPEPLEKAGGAPSSATHHPIELARVTLSAYDLLPDGDYDQGFVDRLATVGVGDWIPMRRPRRLERFAGKVPGASVPAATTSARLVARLVDADHVESWEAEALLADAVRRLHEAAASGDDTDAQAAFDATTAAFAIATLPEKAALGALGDERVSFSREKKGSGEGSGADGTPEALARAKKCLDAAVADARFADGNAPRTVLARACARPTPAGRACALRFLALGATPSVPFGRARWRGGGERVDASLTTAAHVAARCDNGRVLERMLEVDRDGVLRARDGKGYPALHVAVAARAVEAAEVLARGGADPETRVSAASARRRRKSPSSFASRECVGVATEDDAKDASASASHDGGVSSNAFELAVRSGDARIVDAVFAAPRANRNSAARPAALAAALFAAARVGNARAAAAAIAKLRDCGDAQGGDASLRAALSMRSRLGKTALDTAAGRGAADVVRVLLDSGRGDDDEKKGVSASRDAKRAARAERAARAGAAAWAAYARSDEAVQAIVAAEVTADHEWAAACRVAETRGASMRALRVLRGRAGTRDSYVVGA